MKGKAGVIAPYDDAGNPDEGTLYKFNGSGLAASKQLPSAFSIAYTGKKTVIGAAENLTSPSLKSGQAYLLSGMKPKITIPNPMPNAGDAFGFSVAGSKKVVIVGAPMDDGPGPDAGQAYLFTQKSPVPIRTYPNPAPQDGDQFGYAAAVVGNFAYIAAPFDDAHGTDAGVVYVFQVPQQ